LSRVTSFGRALPAPPWRRGWRSRSGRTGFEASPARVVALTTLAALVLGNALILYQVATHNANPSSGRFRPSGDETVEGSLSDVGEVLLDIRASIEARVDSIEPILAAPVPRDERPREKPSERHHETPSAPVTRSLGAGPASSGSDSPGSISSGSSSSGPTGTNSGGSTSDGSGSSSDSGTGGSGGSTSTNSGTPSGDGAGSAGGETGGGGAGGGGGSGGGTGVDGGTGGGGAGGGGG
jgi:hypothetical protein